MRDRSPLILVCVILGLSAALLMAGCGSSTDQIALRGAGVTVSLSDPPTCQAPAGDFANVWVTVTLVRAHLSGGANPDDGGWVDLVDRTEDPVQVDLLGTPDTRCVLATLGSTMGLPPGDYQQIRLHLLSNNPSPGTATPETNNCVGEGFNEGFNCAKLNDGSIVRLDLNSQAQTGLKVPLGRIAGGAISLAEGESADINVDFNVCASFVMGNADRGGSPGGPGGIRLNPTLHAGEVSLNRRSISGRVVDSVSGAPLTDATIFVFAEQPDGENIDRVVMQARADASAGTFAMCPLPEGDYDIVVAAMDGSGVTHHPTIAFEVPAGTDLGDVPVVAQAAPDTSTATIDGQVTSQAAGSTPVSIDAAISALQAATPDGGSERLVTIPPLGSSTTMISTASGADCPAGTQCASYMFFVPAGNPSVGTFGGGGTTFAVPAAGDVLYRFNAQAFLPGSANEPDCSPSSVTVDTDDTSAPLRAESGVTTTAADIVFTGCTAPPP